MNRNTLAADANSAVDAIAHMATHAADQVQQGSHRLADDASRLAQEGRDAASSSAKMLRANAEQWERSARGYIEHKPVRATLMAMAAGAALVMLGSMLTRTRRESR